ncbi:DUF4349 domain-containing protein, partial [Cellulomonas massiliensis]|uniref:DUF4349 domain-containing protein n=1 Tax=Cellulomonas massiliensis TaxID=1465811 RepID=UPI00035C4733
MTSTPAARRRLPRTLTALVATGTLLAALLAGCSAGSGADESGADRAPAGGGAAVVDEEAPGSVGRPAAQTAEDRQVVQEGDVSMTVKDARAAVDSIVAFVSRSQGRVDDWSEQAGDEWTRASASLTVRVPSAELDATIDALRTLGTVGSVQLKATDVTGTARDLDARIAGLELSVDRMTALLASARTHADIVQAEKALTDRQTELEQLESQRAALAEQVSLSTLRIEVLGPVPAGAPADEPGPSSFLGGLAVGWASFTAAVSTLLVVLGVLLPWLLLAGGVTAGAVAWSRR